MNVAQVREICLQLPSVTEDIKWEHDLCFCVGGKMFCVSGIEGDFAVSLKVKPETFGELTQLPGISPAPYLARYNWLLVEKENVWSYDEWHQYISQSYELVRAKLPRKVQAALGG